MYIYIIIDLHVHVTSMCILTSVQFFEKMAGISPHPGDSKQLSAAMQLSPRLKSCWELDIDWKLIPNKLNEVCV